VLEAAAETPLSASLAWLSESLKLMSDCSGRIILDRQDGR